MSRRSLAASLALSTVLVLALAPAAWAARPALVAPKTDTVLAAGTEPTFTARDRSRYARRYGVFIRVAAAKRLTRRGELRATTVGGNNVGTFASTKRRGSTFSYRSQDYSFAHWFMNRPGTYYWQVFRIDCVARGCRRVGRVFSKVGRFTVR